MTTSIPVIFHDLAHRQFPNDAPFTTWTCSNDEIINRVSAAIVDGNHRDGDAEGSMVVTISSSDILTSVVKLEVGQKLVGSYMPRRNTSNSIKTLKAVPQDGQTKLPAKSCEVIVYMMNDEYNIVSVNGSPEETGTPINPNTLLRNYFKIGKEQDHGTNLEWMEMEQKLLQSFMYWENKAMLGFPMSD